MSKRCFTTHRSGLSNLNGRLYSGASAVGAAVPATELGSTGGYYSDFPDADFANADHCRFTTVTWPDEVGFDFGVQNRNEALSVGGGVGGGTGTGAFVITVTVTDGADPLENARVRVAEGVTSLLGTTDADGHAQFSLDAATYAVSVSKPGYSFTPAPRTVTGTETGTLAADDLEMSTAGNLIPPSIDPSMCVVAGYLVSQLDGTPFANALLTATRIPEGPARTTAGILVGQFKQAVSDGDGLVSLEVEKSNEIIPVGTQWRLECREADIDQTVSITADTLDLASFI